MDRNYVRWALGVHDREWHLLPHKTGNPLCGASSEVAFVGKTLITNDPVCAKCEVRARQHGIKIKREDV